MKYWKCPKCEHWFGSEIEPSSPPTHWHTRGSKAYPMEVVDRRPPTPAKLSPMGGGGLQGVGEEPDLDA